MSRIKATKFSPWLEVACVQQCGWKPGRGRYRDEVKAHTRETGHETAVIHHASTHYQRLEGAPDD